MLNLDPTTLMLLITAAVFTVFGIRIGFKSGVKTQSTIIVDMLIQEGYLKFRVKENGETEIQKLNEDS